MEYKNEIFRKETVVLDGNTYLECTFDACILQYNGGHVPMFTSNKFIDCQWAFDGGAAMTIDFLNRLYQSGATVLVDGVIGFIRSAKPIGANSNE